MRHKPAYVPPQNAFAPMVELLEDELQFAGIPVPSGSAASSPAFTQWYLQAVQLLESHVAQHDAHAPMTRAEVELMCRCTLSAATLGQAISLVAQFVAMLHPRAGEVSVNRRRGKARFAIDSLRSQRTMASSLVDIAGLFAFRQLFQWLTGGRVVPLVVGIGSMQRADVLPFLRLFNAPVLAEGELMFLEYDARMLDEKVVASPGDFEVFFQHFPCAVFEVDSELEQQVAALISAAVNQALPIPSQAEIAATLGYPLSTFRRYLAGQSCSYREVRDRCLMDSARDFLQQGHMGIGEIALRLGYSDADTFRKAFRRWQGVSPTHWRNQHAT